MSLKRNYRDRIYTSTYRGKQTKKAKANKKFKVLIWALVFTSLYTSLVLIKLWDMAVGKQMVISETAMAQEELPMKEWVLEEIKSAGIDPYEAYMIINCESRWNDQAINGSHNNGGNGTDLGLWQINTKYQPQVSPKEALDYKSATKHAIEIYKKRSNWSAWACANIVGVK